MDTVYIGIDPTAGRRPMDYAILDRDLHLIERGLGKLEKVLDVVKAYPSAMVAVDAPQSPNSGLMATETRRKDYGLPIHTATWTDYKVCEYELRKRGIRLYHTPGEAAAAPKWMQLGFSLYAALRAEGYQMLRPNADASHSRWMLEVHPHASYTVLLGHVPLRKDSLEGRLQRQLLLYREGLNIPDPMDAFEEITRHHLLEGTLTLPGLFTHDELDALVSAYTAFIAARHPESITFVGDATEGQIVVPVSPQAFKEIYR
jgi:predicted nuclease with RNAse H fold